jgi:dTDP-4-amino-4,6-dideoxygalactose transaminase
MRIIPYGRQHIDSQDIRLVSKALKQDLITTGDYVKKFENKTSKLLGAKYTLSCNSGTSGLHLALVSIDFKKDDVIIMPVINFIAIYNMAKLMKAKIFLADVDPFTGQMTPKTLLECIKNNKLRKIKAIVTMYLGGYPENVIEFYRIKKKFNCYLIEDACHALGAKYIYKKKNIYIGSCKHSDIAVFSMHPVKSITSGEGGFLTTDNKKIYQKAKLFRSHGLKQGKNHWNYEIICNGFNYRLSDINCALALSQFKKLKKFIFLRKKKYLLYKKAFSDLNVHFSVPSYNKNTKPAYHLFLINLNLKNNFFKKNIFFKKMLTNKIIVQYHYKPIFFFKKVYDIKLVKNSFIGAIKYYKSTLSIPIFPFLSSNKQYYIIKVIRKIFFNQKLSRN